MTFHGTVRSRVIVLDSPAELPEGAAVTIQLDQPTLRPKVSRLVKYAGQNKDLPPDVSRNVDRVLYGEQPSCVTRTAHLRRDLRQIVRYQRIPGDEVIPALT